jgi:hypothetical protein
LVITFVFIILCIYRATISLKEEDVLYIDPGEDKLLQEQKEVNAKIERLRPVLIGTFVLVVLLGLATFGLWVFQQLS